MVGKSVNYALTFPWIPLAFSNAVIVILLELQLALNSGPNRVLYTLALFQHSNDCRFLIICIMKYLVFGMSNWYQNSSWLCAANRLFWRLLNNLLNSWTPCHRDTAPLDSQYVNCFEKKYLGFVVAIVFWRENCLQMRLHLWFDPSL